MMKIFHKIKIFEKQLTTGRFFGYFQHKKCKILEQKSQDKTLHTKSHRPQMINDLMNDMIK